MLAYHAGVPVISGGFVGVDVFFVISGFLITGLIVREVQRTGRLALGRFYARRIRRLLPATAVVLVATAALTVLVLPPTRWSAITWEIATAATYVVNWRLADQSVDYLTAENAPSPVQHFWSLAVEEQFYIIWPLLILALVWWHRRSGWSLRRTLMAGLALIAVPSFVWSVMLTDSLPGRAYFVTTTRVWELAAGAALAIAATRLARMPRAAAVVLGWLGLAAIVTAGLAYSSATPFPGTTALLPVLGTAAVIAAGVSLPENGAGRVLRWGPFQDIGALSYSLYLWHWPLVVAATAVFGQLSVAQGVLVVGFSVVPAWLSYRLVEYPIHHARALVTRPGRAFVVGAVATAIGVGAAVVPSIAQPEFDVGADAPGASVLGDDPANDPDAVPVDQVDSITPDPLVAHDDNADVYDDGCHQIQDDASLLSCAYGDTGSDFVVALVGDSHAAQWQPALAEIAETRGWRLETYTKSSCAVLDAEVATTKGDQPYTSCAEWNASLLDHLTGPDAPDIVVASGSNEHAVIRDGVTLSDDESEPLVVDALERSWRTIIDGGPALVVIRNTPWLDLDMPECISANPDQLTECVVPRTDAVAKARDADLVAAERTDGLAMIDMDDAICPGDSCVPVIGGVIVWRDPHHLTATYARSLSARLDSAMQDALGDLGR